MSQLPAIGAAPFVLHKAGVLRGVEVAAHPSVQAQLVDAVIAAVPRVVKTGSVFTSQGVGTAMEFALALVAEPEGRARADELVAAMRV